MKTTEALNSKKVSNAIMNPNENHQPPALATSIGAREKCLVCGEPIGERCFCRIYRNPAAPVALCCPSCSMQYLYSARDPVDDREAELLKQEKSVHLFVGDDKPWL